MPRLYDIQPPGQQVELAVRTKPPAQLAQTFAAYVGQFYDRAAFDALAREVSDLYARESSELASCFRARLDRRLYDRYHTPVAWDVSPRGTELVA
jgi:hypothetical protein